MKPDCDFPHIGQIVYYPVDNSGKFFTKGFYIETMIEDGFEFFIVAEKTLDKKYELKAVLSKHVFPTLASSIISFNRNGFSLFSQEEQK